MSIQTTASERDESRRKRRSNDTATRTSDADTSEAARETDAPRDTAPTHRNASDRPVDGGSSTADRQPTSRAARLQQGQGNRAVARAAAAARDRRDGTESPEDTVGAGDMRGTAPRGNENATDATASTAPEGSGGIESSSSRRQSGSSVRAGTQATPGTSAADVESAAPREQRDTGSQASETGATGEGNRITTKRAQQEGREPSDHAETNQATPLANRQGSHATPTGPQLDGLGVRPKLTVGQPDDQYEREADAVAEAVTAGRAVPASSTGRAGGGDGAVPGLQVDETEELGQTQSHGTDSKPSYAQGQSPTASPIRSPGAGRSLPEGVRRRIAPALGTGLDEVQVHTGAAAARAASNLGARAFTHRNHIFLGSGESPHDLALMAHEATHVVQQGAASTGHLSESTAPPDVQRVLSQSALQTLSSFTGAIPGWDKFTALLGKDPVTDEPVDKPPSEVLEEVVDLLPPWGKSILNALGEYELITDAFNLVQEELKQSDLSVNRVMTLLERAWEQLGFSDLVLGSDEGAIGILKEGFRDLYEDVVTFADDLVEKFLDLIQDVAVDVAESLLSEAGAWELATKVLGRDPLRDEEVDASPTEILEDFLILFDREQHLKQMREQGTLEETATWLNEQLDQFTDLLSDLRDLIKRTWDLLTPAELPNLSSNLESLVTDAIALLSDVWDFVSTLAKEVLARIKESLLGWLNEFAREHITGFDLLTVIAGQNPFTGKDVARTGERLIQGFIRLLPNGREIYQELAETGIVAEAGARIDEAVDDLEITWEYLRGLFVDLWEGFTIEDIAEPPAAFQRIINTFQEPVTRIVNFVSVVLGEIFRVALKAMNFPSDLLGSIINNVMGAIDAIKADPLGFLTNMLEAVELGFRNFFDNILTHLVGGLTDWLFEELRDAGLEPPSDFSLGSVLEFVLDVIGVTTDRLWEKLADRVGEENVERIREAMDMVTGVWEFVRDVQQQGIAAIWEYVTSQLRGLWDSVLELAQEWIVEKVINRAIEWLGGLLDPTGVMTVINSFQAFFNALQSAAEYLRDILAIIDDYVSTIVAVAQGQLETGAQTLEEGLASSIPVAIGFLARQLELGDIGQKIKEIVEGIREKIDQALEWLLDKAENALSSVLGAIRGDGDAEDADGEVVEGEPFQILDEQHRLRVRIEDGTPTVEMASESWGELKKVMRDLTDEYGDALVEPADGDGEGTPLKQELEALEQRALRERKRIAGLDDREQMVTESREMLDDLRREIGHLGQRAGVPGYKLPSPNIKLVDIDQGRPRKVVGERLSHKTVCTGDPASASPVGRGIVSGGKARKQYDRGHLVARMLGGHGGFENLTMLSKNANQNDMKEKEKYVKKKLQKEEYDTPPVIDYTAEAEYPTAAAGLQRLTKELAKLGAPENAANRLLTFIRADLGVDDLTNDQIADVAGEGLDTETVERNQEAIRQALAEAFFAEWIEIKIDVLQPEDGSVTIKNPSPIENHQ